MRFFALLALLTASGCGGADDGFESNRTQAPPPAPEADGEGDGEGDGQDATGKKPAPGKPGAKPAPGAPGGETPGGETPGETPGGNTPAPEGGEAFFATKVAPVLQANCIGCHADPRMPVEVRGPLSIYSYNNMRALLGSGGGAQDNAAFNKVRNVVAHTGGDRCGTGVGASPCKELIDWWVKEFGGDGGGMGEGTFGKISEVTALGRVYGWAFDPDDTMATLTVTFYADGPKGTGTLAGTAVANKAGADGNAPGDHAFTLDLPPALRNGKAHDLYAYVTVEAVEKPLTSAAAKYTAYAFTQAGRDYYEANVRGQLGACAACHTVSYEQQYYSMIAPSPAQGGTVTNNQLINKASQTNGVAHGGGLRCGNANAAPCSNFQAWWNLEFGGG